MLSSICSPTRNCLPREEEEEREDEEDAPLAPGPPEPQPSSAGWVPTHCAPPKPQPVFLESFVSMNTTLNPSPCSTNPVSTKPVSTKPVQARPPAHGAQSRGGAAGSWADAAAPPARLPAPPQNKTRLCAALSRLPTPEQVTFHTAGARQLNNKKAAVETYCLFPQRQCE